MTLFINLNFNIIFFYNLQEVTNFHLLGSKEVVRMHTLMMDDSVSVDSFDVPQWIKVTTLTRDSRS